MGVNIKKGTALDAINLTPMIDVVFLLLLFFIMATRFEAEEREMSVVLPQASEAKPQTLKPKEIFINVSAEGEYLVDRERRSPKQLLAFLQQASTNNPGRQSVVIRGDERCPWKFVALAMNLCNQANIRNYTVAAAGPEARK